MKYLFEQSLMWLGFSAFLGFFVGYFVHVVYCRQKKTILKSSIIAARDKTQQEKTKVKELKGSNQTLRQQIKAIQLKNEIINKAIESQQEKLIKVRQQSEIETKTSQQTTEQIEQIEQLKILNQTLEKQLKTIQLENKKINEENKRQKEKRAITVEKEPTENETVKEATPQNKGSQPKQLANEKDQADDLRQIIGIGPAIEKGLNKIGVYTYQQIADFNEENILWVDTHFAFPGRIKRDKWIEQCAALVKS